jgi:hypothetical protein
MTRLPLSNRAKEAKSMTIQKSFPLLVCTALAFGVVAAGCGGSGGGTVSAATFCSEVKSFATKYQGLQSSLAPPAKTTLQSAAADLQKYADSAPSAVKAPTQTEANALAEWAKNGDDTAMHSSTVSTADQKVADYCPA